MYIYSFNKNRIGDKLTAARIRCTSSIDDRLMLVYVDGGLFTSTERNNDAKRFYKERYNGFVVATVPRTEGVSYRGRLWLHERDDELALYILQHGG